jgi:hypothetical protein
MLFLENIPSDSATPGIGAQQRRKVKKERRLAAAIWASESPCTMATCVAKRAGQTPQEQFGGLRHHIAVNGCVGGAIALQIDRSGVTRSDGYEVSKIHRQTPTRAGMALGRRSFWR